MIRRFIYVVSCFCFIGYISSCSKASEDELAPAPSQCDTSGMKYSTNILPIISSNCYGCHGNGTATDGVDLDGYAKLKTYVDNGYLIGVITHASGYTPMPYGAAKLSDCDINKIKAWINNGSPNN